MSSNMRNIGEYVLSKNSLVPILNAAATLTGVAIDRAAIGMPLSAVVEVDIGLATGTPDSFTVDVTVEDDTASSPTAATTQKTIATKTASGHYTANLDMSAYRQFVRAKAVIAFVNGTSPKVPVGINFVFGGMPELATVTS